MQPGQFWDWTPVGQGARDSLRGEWHAQTLRLSDELEREPGKASGVGMEIKRSH